MEMQFEKRALSGALQKSRFTKKNFHRRG